MDGRLIAINQSPTLIDRMGGGFAVKIRSVGLSEKTDLRHCNWSGICFDGEDLRGFDFSGCDLSGCSFKGTRVEGAVFRDVKLDRSTLFEIAQNGAIIAHHLMKRQERPHNLYSRLKEALFGSKAKEHTEHSWSILIDALKAAGLDPDARPRYEFAVAQQALARLRSLGDALSSVDRSREIAIVETSDGDAIVVDQEFSSTLGTTVLLPDFAALSPPRNVLRDHVRFLSSRRFWSRLPANTTFVVLLLPSEAAFNAALAQDPNLYDDARAAKIILASPSALTVLVTSILPDVRGDSLQQKSTSPPVRFETI